MLYEVNLVPFEKEDLIKIKGYFLDKTVLFMNRICFRYLSESQLMEMIMKTNDREHPVLLINNHENINQGIIIFEKQKPMATGTCCFIFLWHKENYADIFLKVTHLLASYVFENLNQERLSVIIPFMVDIINENLINHGFEKEVIFREDRFVNGAYMDTVRVGVLREEYKYD